MTNKLITEQSSHKRNLLHLFSITLIVLLSGMSQLNAQTSTLYDFNTTGQLGDLFNGTGATGSVTQVTTGGIGNTGAITVPLSSTNAIFATKEGYSLASVGSTYTFESFIKSEGNNGYSGVGFTASSPATASTSFVYRPNDALGVSVHGGGFVFHNGATDYSGSWGTTYSSGAITTIKASTCVDLINNNTACGSPDKWFRIVFKVTIKASSTFDMRVEVWPADSDGTIRFPSEANAIFEVREISNTTISNTPIIYSYFNFSGVRITHFDNYAVNLTGGASVIQAGAPVVLTSSTSQEGSAVTVNGEVTSENGSAVSERGIVYSTTSNPTIADHKITSGSGLGSFSATTPSLAAGTYYFRAYATNSTGTSYGSELSEIIIPNTAQPIRLLYFKAEKIADGRVQLDWATASEENNDYFLIERSLNGKEWVAIIQMPGAGNSSQTRTYQYIDENPILGISYYRLRQVDYDGTTSTSPLERIIIEGNDKYLKLALNPVSAQLFIINNYERGTQFHVYNAQGSLVYTSTIDSEQTTIEVYSLPMGVYILKVLNNPNPLSLRFLKK
jgi:hypothetical protein